MPVADLIAELYSEDEQATLVVCTEVCTHHEWEESPDNECSQ